MYSVLQENTALDPFGEWFLCVAYKKACQLRADAFFQFSRTPVMLHDQKYIFPKYIFLYFSYFVSDEAYSVY